MSRQFPGRGNDRGNGGALARGAGFAAAKGAGLIGLAVLIGILILNVVDDGSVDPDASSAAATTTSTSTASTTETTGATTPTSDAVPAKTPAELAVLVLNGGAEQGSARTSSENLKLLEYTNQLEPSDWADREQDGNVVMCKAGLDQEAAALAAAVGQGTPTEPFVDPPPPGSDAADCVVVVGAVP